MVYMFRDCSSLTNLDISKFNTQGVYRMDYMFYNCISLKSLNLASFNTEKCTSFEQMFGNCNMNIYLKRNLCSNLVSSVPSGVNVNDA